MVTKLKRNKVFKIFVHILLLISFCVFDASYIIKESINGDSNWENTLSLVQKYQCASYVKIIALVVFIAVLLLILVYSSPFQSFRQTCVMLFVVVALCSVLVIYKIHMFSYPIWYDDEIKHIIVREVFLDTIIVVPSAFLIVKVLKSIPHGMLRLARKKVEMENEEKRVALEKMRQDLLANISHDLRTPLTSIISYIDILKNQELSGDAVEYVEIIDNKANVLRNMVDDIVYLSKLTSGSMHVNMEKINLKCFLEQVLFEWKVDNEQLADFIEYTVVGEETIVENDGSKLYRVFQNLLDNVVKYKKENSIIEIKYENIDERYVTIEIKNESSYPLQFQGDDMLERFVRTRNSEGHGLGLAIATELVKLCKGKMEIKVEEVFFIVKLSFEKIG